MTKHFFTFRKHTTIGGQPLQVDIEVIVAADISRSEARQIANEEIAALQDGHASRVHGELRTRIAEMEKTVKRIPDYRFLGSN